MTISKIIYRKKYLAWITLSSVSDYSEKHLHFRGALVYLTNGW